MNVGRGNKERWEQARALASQGCWMSEAARILKIHHTAALYISRKMGFKWAACPARYAHFKPYKFGPHKKPVVAELYVSDEPAEYVERLMRLAGA